MDSSDCRPSLELGCWKRVAYVKNHLPFYASTVISKGGITFKFTNMMQLWEEVLDAQMFSQKLLDLNANVTGDVTPLHDKIAFMVLELDPSCTYSPANVTEEVLEVECKCLLSGLPLLWKITAEQASPEMLFVDVIRPLMAIVMHAERREKELISQICYRDRFIEDLLDEGVKSPKKASKWTKFDSCCWHRNYFLSEQAAEVQKFISSCVKGPFDENAFNEKLMLLEKTVHFAEQEQCDVSTIPTVADDQALVLDEEIPEEIEAPSPTATTEKTPKKKTRRLLRL
uniref:Non-homologous end-joining factor 1 n=1 Tax=Trichuris muris TaxID=70415 RepID=A0A5S6QU04_TRIMR